MNANDIRRGMIIMYNGGPHRVLDFQHRTPGNLRAFVQAKLRNLKNGSSTEVRFSSTENIERAALEDHEMEYLYADGDMYHFKIFKRGARSEEHTSELQSRFDLVCRLLLEKKKVRLRGFGT